jgi:hypothetical protein
MNSDARCDYRARGLVITQFGEQLQIQANGYIHTPALNATGLTAYDFTLSFSTAGQLRTPAPPSANKLCGLGWTSAMSNVGGGVGAAWAEPAAASAEEVWAGRDAGERTRRARSAKPGSTHCDVIRDRLGVRGSNAGAGAN